MTSFALSMITGSPAPLGASARRDGVNFAVVAPHADVVHICIFDEGDREMSRFRLPSRYGDIHCGFLSGVGAGCRYGLRAEGPWVPELGHRFDTAKLLTDPYATRLDRPFAWNAALAAHGADTADLVPKTIVENQLPPVTPQVQKPLGLVYELPVKAFTFRHPDVPENLRGTVAALAQPCVVKHLLDLGVDTVELMPLCAWIDERHLPPLGLANAWGYNPVALLAPDPRLAPGGMAEIRETLAKLHEAGLRVLLDVVVNHSGESDTDGATLSLRGLDNALYYAHTPDGRLVNETGCGNTLALEKSHVVRLVMDALRHWAAAGFDGFRFDLGTILGRTVHGFDPQSPLLASIAQDPILSRLKLVAEPWHAAAGGYRLGGFPYPWHEWNDRYRDRVRRFWRGDLHSAGEFATVICGSSDVFSTSRRSPAASVNFLAAHDGFTLHDVVHHAHKQNEANGEDNRDGHTGEIAWVSATPGADIRAMLTTLMMSRGTPMLTAGDEFGRTQHGNNNAYAQDNAVTWLDWTAADPDLIAFTARLSALRRQLEPVGADVFLEGRDIDGSGFEDATWLNSSGEKLSVEQWASADLATFAIVLVRGQRVVLWFNRAHASVVCRLPIARTAYAWRIAVDSSDDRRQCPVDDDKVTVAARSVLLTVELPLTEDDGAPSKKMRSAGTTDEQTATLAQAAGIEPDWYEVDGTHHRVTPATQRELLGAMRLPNATSDDIRYSLGLLRSASEVRTVPMNATLPEGRRGDLAIVLPEAMGRRRICLVLTSEAGNKQVLEFAPGDLTSIGTITHDGARYQRYALPMPPLPAGFYKLRLDPSLSTEGHLIVHPTKCYLPEQLREPHHSFGLASHLYSLRDERDAGIGDLGTLGRFAELTKNFGGVTAGINPLHHLFPTNRQRASPYQPSDRNFIDPIYIDLDSLVAELGGDNSRLVMDGFSGDFGRLRKEPYVDYARVWEVKERVLRAVFADCAHRPLPALDRYILEGGDRLAKHALFECLAARAGTVDRGKWPAPWQAPTPSAQLHLSLEYDIEIRFRSFLQWCLDGQLEAAGGGGPVLGLYRDLALGVAYDGGEVWSRPDLFATTVSIGAPPDPFAAAGQVWNLPPFIPRYLQADFYKAVADILTANMRAAGALRVDHILGYARQFWVPRGAEGSTGAYVNFPADDLIALTSLLSSRAGCCVIGEDLGTVPAGLREKLAAANILSYRVLRLERDRDGGFLPPESYPRKAVACLSTHDLPPFLGYVKSADTKERRALESAMSATGIEPGKSEEDLLVAAHMLGAKASSALMLIQTDDIAGEIEPLTFPAPISSNRIGGGAPAQLRRWPLAHSRSA